MPPVVPVSGPPVVPGASAPGLPASWASTLARTWLPSSEGSLIWPPRACTWSRNAVDTMSWASSSERPFVIALLMLERTSLRQGPVQLLSTAAFVSSVTLSGSAFLCANSLSWGSIALISDCERLVSFCMESLNLLMSADSPLFSPAAQADGAATATATAKPNAIAVCKSLLFPIFMPPLLRLLVFFAILKSIYQHWRASRRRLLIVLFFAFLLHLVIDRKSTRLNSSHGYI